MRHDRDLPNFGRMLTEAARRAQLKFVTRNVSAKIAPADDGSVGGIFCANTDDIRRVIGERQLSLLRELAATTAEARTWQTACERSAQALAEEFTRSALYHDLHA